MTNKETNLDGWMNAFTNMGIANKDALKYTSFESDSTLPDEILVSLYKSGGIAGRIVDVVANSMTSKWINIPEDTDGIILQYLKNIKAKTRINKAIKWSRLFGGGLIVIGVNDGIEDLTLPVNTNAIKSIDYLKVFDKRQISIKEFYDNNEPAVYTLNNLSAVDDAVFDIHESRCLIFQGIDLPDQEKAENGGFGLSVLQRYWTELKNLGTVYHSTALLTKEFNQGILKVNGLNDMLANDQSSQLIERMRILQISKSMINMLMIDGEREEFTELTKNVSGLPEIIDKNEGALSGVSGIPQTLLYGRSPAGMNATGESDADNYRSLIESDQNDYLQPELEKLINYIILSSDCTFNSDFTIEFNPLYSPSEKEEAETKYTVAQTDNLYIMNGTLSPSEIALSRFGGDAYSMDTLLSDENRDFNMSEPDNTDVNS